MLLATPSPVAKTVVLAKRAVTLRNGGEIGAALATLAAIAIKA
jgi:hypothetical protein